MRRYLQTAPRRVHLNVGLIITTCGLLATCSSSPSPPTPAQPSAAGIVIMAHGGDPAWNSAIHAAVEPLRPSLPVEIAFGMASRATLAGAIGKLEERGVQHIAVVRLFVSGESFLHQTEYLLGLRPDAPRTPVRHGQDASHPNTPVTRRARLGLSAEGLVESPLIGQILVDRVRDLSRNPERESVLLLAHGMGDDAANDRLLYHMERRADQVRAVGPFRTVQVETLREDWAADRETAEQRIRDFVTRARGDNGIAIVVPLRVSGFGPYGRVLEGHVYRHDGRGLSPHPLLTEWIRDQAEKALTAGS